MSEPVEPAFYASGGGALRQWWTLLHPPYTLWHLAYVVIGACLAPMVDWDVLLLTVLAFALALGVGAHAVDEWHSRPLGTSIPGPALIAAAVVSVAAACAIGLAVSRSTTGWLVLAVALGAVLVPLYNLELLGGIVHNELGFGLAWGAFPVLTAYLAQTGTLSVEACIAAGWATVLSVAQRRLSTAARWARREVVAVEGEAALQDGSTATIDRDRLLQAPEAALRALTLAVVLLAAALVALRV